jgi:hypothetical protein
VCSSPKSSGTVRKSHLKGVFEDMDPSTRASFVTKSNAAQDTRDKRKSAATKRNGIATPKRLSKKVVSNKKAPVKDFFCSVCGIGMKDPCPALVRRNDYSKWATFLHFFLCP